MLHLGSSHKEALAKRVPCDEVHGGLMAIFRSGLTLRDCLGLSTFLRIEKAEQLELFIRAPRSGPFRPHSSANSLPERRSSFDEFYIFYIFSEMFAGSPDA